MRKIAISRFGGPEVLELVEVPTPTLGPEDVLVKAHAIGGHPPGSFFDDWRRHMEKCISIQYFSSHVWEHDRAELMRFGLQMIELMLSGKVKPPPGTFFPLARAVDAHCLLESGEHVGRIFLRP